MPQAVTKLHLGDKAPDFNLSDATGKSYQLSELLQHGPVLLNFFRGTWCGTCRSFMQRLDRQQPVYQSQGVQVIGIAHQRAGLVANYFRLEPLGYPYLLDTNLRVISSYGILTNHADDEDRQKSETRQTTLPSVFLVDQQGIIRWVHVGLDYADLPTNEQLEAQISLLTDRQPQADPPDQTYQGLD